MPYKFNPFTNALDYFESGGGGGSAFFAGEVATYADLPLDGTAALDSRWLVRSNSGTWPFSSYKQAGVYVRKATGGTDRDADYQLTDTTFFDVMSDNKFLVFDNSDATKGLAFDVGTNVPTSSTVTLTVPAASGTIARTETFAAPPAIGDTTPAAGTFTTLTANNGTLTASAPVLDLAQTWNDSGVTFTGIKGNFTNTASASASLLIDLQVGGTSQFWVRRDGMTAVTALRHPTNTTTAVLIGGTGSFNSATLAVGSQVIRLTSLTPITWGPGANHLDTADLVLLRDAAQTLAQRNGTNAQTFNIYNTYTSSTNFERLLIGWASNIVSIKPEAGGSGGTVRELHISGLPTSNPGPGILWDDAGTVKVGT